jgi:hypothetical protein
MMKVGFVLYKKGDEPGTLNAKWGGIHIWGMEPVERLETPLRVM